MGEKVLEALGDGAVLIVGLAVIATILGADPAVAQAVAATLIELAVYIAVACVFAIVFYRALPSSPF